MSLQDWEKRGWVTKHKTSPQEIEELFQIADRDLKDCQAEHLSEDWQLNIAYNAALQSAKAAMVAAGYRVSREAQHFRIVQSLEFTLELEKSEIDKLDQFRKKRNISGYERAGLVSEGEVGEGQLTWLSGLENKPRSGSGHITLIFFLNFLFPG